MEEISGNKSKFIETAILKRSSQNNTEKLSKRLFSSLKILRFQAVGS